MGLHSRIRRCQRARRNARKNVAWSSCESGDWHCPHLSRGRPWKHPPLRQSPEKCCQVQCHPKRMVRPLPSHPSPPRYTPPPYYHQTTPTKNEPPSRNRRTILSKQLDCGILVSVRVLEYDRGLLACLFLMSESASTERTSEARARTIESRATLRTTWKTTSLSAPRGKVLDAGTSSKLI